MLSVRTSGSVKIKDDTICTRALTICSFVRVFTDLTFVVGNPNPVKVFGIVIDFANCVCVEVRENFRNLSIGKLGDANFSASVGQLSAQKGVFSFLSPKESLD